MWFDTSLGCADKVHALARKVHSTTDIDTWLHIVCFHLLYSCWRPKSGLMPSDDKVLSFGDSLIRRSDVDLLRGPFWLNDTVSCPAAVCTPSSLHCGCCGTCCAVTGYEPICLRCR